jgi:hypothetical protein
MSYHMSDNDSHFTIRVELEQAKRERRRKMPLHVRAQMALTQALALSDTDAAAVGRETARVQAGSSPPAPDNSLYSRYERKLRLIIEAFEREIDAEVCRPTSADLPQETPEQRDLRLINKFEGIPSHEVSFLDGSFGSPRSIERTRAKYGRRPKDGVLQHM